MVEIRGDRKREKDDVFKRIIFIVSLASSFPAETKFPNFSLSGKKRSDYSKIAGDRLYETLKATL